jgi:hypothetical protein
MSLYLWSYVDESVLKIKKTRILGKPRLKRYRGGPRYRYKNNVKMAVYALELEDRKCLNLDQRLDYVE